MHTDLLTTHDLKNYWKHPLIKEFRCKSWKLEVSIRETRIGKSFMSRFLLSYFNLYSYDILYLFSQAFFTENLQESSFQWENLLIFIKNYSLQISILELNLPYLIYKKWSRVEMGMGTRNIILIPTYLRLVHSFVHSLFCSR